MGGPDFYLAPLIAVLCILFMANEIWAKRSMWIASSVFLSFCLELGNSVEPRCTLKGGNLVKSLTERNGQESRGPMTWRAQYTSLGWFPSALHAI